MAIPSTAQIFEEAMDPYDVVDFEIDVKPLLETGENIASYTISVPTESTLLGLTVGGTGYTTTKSTQNVIKIYLSIAASSQANTTFRTGVLLPLEISIITNSSPARKKQRTCAVKVIER